MNELLTNKCYLRILGEFRELKQIPKKPTLISNKSSENKIRELFSKPQTHRKVVSEHFPKVPKLKFEYTFTKNHSPRFRIIKNVTTAQTTRNSRTSINLTNRTYLTPNKQPFFRALPQIKDVPKDETPQIEISTCQTQQSPSKTIVSEFQSPRIMQHFDFDQQLIKSNIQAPKRTKKQLRMVLLRAINKLKAMNIDPQQMIKDKVFSKKPYQRPLSHEFIHAVKLNQIDKVKILLEQNRYLVFDFDFYNMTGLHWACKKGLISLAELLIQNHADVDAVDILHRTPLYLAIQGNYIQIIETLLKNKAYPWSTYYTDLTEVVKDNRRVQKMLTLVRRIDIINTWGDKKVLEEDCI